MWALHLFRNSDQRTAEKAQAAQYGFCLGAAQEPRPGWEWRAVVAVPQAAFTRDVAATAVHDTPLQTLFVNWLRT